MKKKKIEFAVIWLILSVLLLGIPLIIFDFVYNYTIDFWWIFIWLTGIFIFSILLTIWLNKNREY